MCSTAIQVFHSVHYSSVYSVYIQYQQSSEGQARFEDTLPSAPTGVWTVICVWMCESLRQCEKTQKSTKFQLKPLLVVYPGSLCLICPALYHIQLCYYTDISHPLFTGIPLNFHHHFTVLTYLTLSGITAHNSDYSPVLCLEPPSALRSRALHFLLVYTTANQLLYKDPLCTYLTSPSHHWPSAHPTSCSQAC